MNRWLLLLCLGTMVCVPQSALGDGCVIPATAFAKMEIPDQRALIQFADGKETLIIDTSFKGDGTNFAWIVPVPSKPEVEVATTGLFTTLQFIFQPNVRHDFTHYFSGAILLGAFLLSLMWTVKRGESVLGMLLLWFLGFFLFGMVLSASSRSTGYAGNGVNVLERKTVGIYDTVTLSSPDGFALLDWLNANGFATPTNFLPAIRAYAKEGWFFVASKVRLDTPMNEPAKAHPLSFTFKTTRPVYPLRLTGINNPRCKIELYAFGNGRAEIPNFSVERCEQPSYPLPGGQRSRWKSDDLRIGHPFLQKVVADSLTATKLSGDLSSAQMKDDAYITWMPFRQKRPVYYSHDGAALLAVNITVSALVLAVLVFYSASGSAKPWAQKARRLGGALALAACLAGSAAYFSVPKIPVVVTTLPGLRTEMLNRWQIPSALKDAWQGSTNAKVVDARPDLAWVREQLAPNSRMRNQLGTDDATNFFLAQPLREEDSPGNYTLRESAEGIDYVWYDADGAEHVELLFSDD